MRRTAPGTKPFARSSSNVPPRRTWKRAGPYEGPIKSGAYFAVKIVIQDLKKARQAAGLTLAAVSKLTGMDQATLSRLENGRHPNPTIDTLWRYAGAVGKKLVLGHAEPAATVIANGKASKAKLHKGDANTYQRRT